MTMMMMIMMIYCVGTGCMRWIFFQNTNVANTLQQINARTLEACQEACYANAQCNGIDWTAAATQCMLSLPSSGAKNIGSAFGTNHYDLRRDCEGNNDGRDLQC